MLNLKQSTIEILNKMGYTIILWNESYSSVSCPVWAVEISIHNEDTNFDLNISNPPKKKEITVKWILSKIHSKSDYESLADTFDKIIKVNKMKTSLTLYPTTYGIGLFSLFGKDEKTIDELRKILEANGIKFKNEFSEQGWVYRFKISKSKRNVEKIKKFIAAN